MVTLSIGFKPFVYLWSCDLFRAKFEQLKEKRIDFFVPDIPERDDFKYYVFPGKNYITSSSWYERLMKNAPQGAVIVDDWYHGYAIMCDYYQGVLGLRKDLAFIRWFEIYGGTDLQKDDIEKQVVQVISDRGEILLSTTEYEISTLIERLNKKGSYSVSRRGLYFVVSHTF
jgi:hypothetical protein